MCGCTVGVEATHARDTRLSDVLCVSTWWPICMQCVCNQLPLPINVHQRCATTCRSFLAPAMACHSSTSVATCRRYPKSMLAILLWLAAITVHACSSVRTHCATSPCSSCGWHGDSFPPRLWSTTHRCCILPNVPQHQRQPLDQRACVGVLGAFWHR